MKEISNRSATFHFAIEHKFDAGMQLVGTEVKTLRKGQASFNDCHCLFMDNELWIKNLHIPEYSFGNKNNHNPVRDRKLLLNKKELNKLLNKTKEKGFTIIPLRIYFAESGYAKIEIALAKGKKSFDKRHSIKEKDAARQLQRVLNY